MRSISFARVRSTLVTILTVILFMGCAAMMSKAHADVSVKVRVNLENGKPAQMYDVTVKEGSAMDSAYGWYDTEHPSGDAAKASFADVMLSVHQKLYGADAAGKMKFSYNASYYSYSVDKLFGIESSNFSYKVNDLQQGYNTVFDTTVKDGDTVSVYYVEGSWPDVTKYYFFSEPDKIKGDKEGNVPVTVMTTDYDADFNEIAVPAEGVTVALMNLDKTISTAVTDKDGKAVLTVKASGQYEMVINSVKGVQYIAVPGVKEFIYDRTDFLNSVDKVTAVPDVSKKTIKITFKDSGADDYLVKYKVAGAKNWKTASTDGKTSYTIKKVKKGTLMEIAVEGRSKDYEQHWCRTALSDVARVYMGQVSAKRTALKKGFKVKAKKIKKATYELEYGLKKDLKGAVKKTFKTNKTTWTVKKLKAKKTYYMRYRPVMKKSGKKYFGAWSKTFKVKTK